MHREELYRKIVKKLKGIEPIHWTNVKNKSYENSNCYSTKLDGFTIKVEDFPADKYAWLEISDENGREIESYELIDEERQELVKLVDSVRKGLNDLNDRQKGESFGRLEEILR